MKQTFLILALFALTQVAQAQSKIKVGVGYNIGASTYYGNKMNSAHMIGEELPIYSMKISNGIGAKGLYAINDKLGITFNAFYQQRGAIFDRGIYTYNPSYKFNYLDLMLGVAYQTKEIIKKSKLCFNLAGGYNRLLNSQRVNNYEAYNLVNDSKATDFSSLASVGLNIPRVEKDIIQISLFANAGFKTVFGGVLADNGQVGKNLVIGLQIGYLFGFNKKE
jgi:hypothetical protein